MRTNRMAYLAVILAALSAPVPCRAEADLKLPHERVTLVAPPFVHVHEQVAKSGSKIMECPSSEFLGQGAA
jgi:nitrite reductase (NO-forming)